MNKVLIQCLSLCACTHTHTYTRDPLFVEPFKQLNFVTNNLKQRLGTVALDAANNEKTQQIEELNKYRLKQIDNF